jgi:TRAP-type mannitol/chloroaromatic compound transport system substrate-binding protein
MKRTLVITAILALGFAGNAVAQSRTLKMQASWPSTVTAWDNFRFIAERLDKTTAGAIKIDTLTAGQIVPAFEVLDASHKKVLDGAHSIAYYWVGKNKTAVLFTGGPGGPYGMDMIDFLGWMYEGGGWEMYREFYQEVLKLNVIAFPTLPTSPQAFGWFKRPIKDLKDFKGLKCRQTGINAEVFQRMGFTPQQQEIVRSVANESFSRWWPRWQKGQAEAMKELQEKHGVRILRTPPDILNAFLKAWDEVIVEESAKNPFFKKVIDSQREYASVVVPAKRFLFPPYSFAANYYWPEKKPAPAKQKDK